jgi:pimeloyl-ACP methyl ester carboxylesterase/DNA-binding SARP family transcriptional activator
MLGPLRVDFAGRALGSADFGGRKPKQVLEILLVHLGQAVPKDRVADLLWGERLPADPMRTLEAYVSGLRARLHPDPEVARRVLRTEPGAYRFVVEGGEVDQHSFDELVARAAAAPAGQRLELRRRALRLVRGELLADEPYADWLMPLRNLYHERWLQLLLDLADDELAAGRPQVAVEHAERVLAAQPTRERAYRLLVVAHHAAGEQDRALEAYERCRRVLDEQLGVRPLPETERAWLAVLRQQPPPAPAPAPLAAPGGGRARRPPQTRFARNGEVTIAYQTVGSGLVDVVFAHAWFSHMEVGWEEPRYAAWLHRLARGRRLILFDRRGMGMSDPAPPTVSLAERAGDIRAVLDDVGSRRAVLFGSCGAGPLAISLAAREPARVCGLILFGTFPRMMAASDYPAGWTPEFFTRYQAGLEQGWATGRGIARSVPTAGDDEGLREWLGRLLRLSVSPAAARAILDFGATLDVRGLLGELTMPTLVLHRDRDQWVSPANGRYLAARIPGAEYVELSGADHWPWFGDAESVLAPIERFLDQIPR